MMQYIAVVLVISGQSFSDGGGVMVKVVVLVMVEVVVLVIEEGWGVVVLVMVEVVVLSQC